MVVEPLRELELPFVKIDTGGDSTGFNPASEVVLVLEFEPIAG